MGWFFVKFTLLVLVFHHQVCDCCIEKERTALLDLKAFFNSNAEEAEHMLPSWTDDSKSDCCQWERVACSLITGHVQELKLNGLRKAISIFPYKPLLLNVSLFLPFMELLRLDISVNDLSCCVKNEGLERLSGLMKLESLNLAHNDFPKIPEGGFASLERLNLSNTASGLPFPAQELSSLTNLEILDLSWNSYTSTNQAKDFELLSKLPKLRYLDLSYNYFNKNMLRFLGRLSGLEHLSLEYNEMKYPIVDQELVSLSNLEVLNLRQNELNGTFPFQDLMSLRNLKILDLSFNSFSGSIPPNIGALSSLRALSLAGNQLNGSLPVPALCELKNLQELDLSSNSLMGFLPECLANLSSLIVLDISMNRFSGNISLSLISSLRSLEYVDLSHNRFQGSFPFSIFANHSRLAIVDLGNNNQLEVETEYPNSWSAKFQLEVLMLSNCILNKLIGAVPKFLLHQHKLKVVDLSHNNLTGTFPYRLLENMTMLQVLSLRNNTFYGQINLPASSCTSIFWMDLSSNNFDGQLQPNLGNIFPNVTYLNLSRNAFEGTIPASIYAMSGLYRLDLSLNNFSGEVPKQLVGGCVSLDTLKLSGNNFHGQILSSHFNLTELTILHLNDNAFSGAISNGLSKSTRLIKFDVSNNYMSGEIPKWSSNMSSLESIIMRNNFFRGNFPDLRPTTFLDLSNNMLSGALSSWPDLQFLKHIHLQGNKFTGSLPENFANVSSLLTLDIRDNNFTGSIPTTIDAASNLRVLLLGGNRLSGPIPNQLCKLDKISLLDLSNNLFSGSIPSCFKDIAFGKIGASDPAFLQTEFLTWYFPAIGNYGYLLPRMFILLEHLQDMDNSYNAQDEVEFITKSRHSSYRGDILNFMSGLDLSCNNLTGEIPFQLGELAWIHAMNFSRNHLVGSIPKSLSKLKQIESLDLSHNSLSGEIPSELTDLNFLGAFSVAYNNLSGRIPDGKAQFGTFENSSYQGNPFLCGPPLINCSSDDEPPPSAMTKPEKTDSRWYEINLVFLASFSASYIIFLIGVVTLLHINPHWQQRLFNYFEEFLYSCYFCFLNIRRKFRCWF